MIVIRVPAGSDPGLFTSVRSAILFFAGDIPVRIYDEQKECLLPNESDWRIEWTRETSALLMERFGVENFGVL